MKETLLFSDGMNEGLEQYQSYLALCHCEIPCYV